MNIVVDVMGGDFSPHEQIMASVRAANDFDTDITLVGDKNIIDKELKEAGYSGDRIKTADAAEVITNNEEPALAVRRKKNSSVVVAAKIAASEGDALVSCGNTGAVLAAGVLIIGRMKNVMRPALAPLLPTVKKPVLLLDCGANADCKSENLKQFAVMGSAYMQCVMERENPRVSLANIGAEEHKGNELAKSAYQLLKQSSLNFTGNIEGREMFAGDTDVIVSDGFTGNMILKLTEGLSEQLIGMIKDVFMTNPKTMLAAAMVKSELKEFKKRMDYNEYGGALLLGCKRPVIKCHGASKESSVYHAIAQAKKCVESKMLEKIETGLSDM